MAIGKSDELSAQPFQPKVVKELPSTKVNNTHRETQNVVDPHPAQTSAKIPMADYPQISNVVFPETTVEIQNIVNGALGELDRVLVSRKFEDLHKFFASTSYWRDHLGVSTRNYNTLMGAEAVIQYLRANGKENMIGGFEVEKGKTPVVTAINPLGTHKCIQSYITWGNAIGRGKGLVMLIPDSLNNDEWRIYNLFTSLRQLKDFPEQDGDSRDLHSIPESVPRTINWKDYMEDKKEFRGQEPAVLIVGAGHCGLMTAARLKMLGVSTLIIDKQDRSGDNWRKRYYDLALHDSSHMNAMPYLKYPTSWPILAAKDKIADFFEMYEKLLELIVWNKTQIVKSDWDAERKVWTVEVDRFENGKFESRILHPRHIVQATGLNGEPRIPNVKGKESFKGRMRHSSEISETPLNYEGRKIIVLGTGTSGHDLATSFYRRGADVTIVQRGPVLVGSLKTVHAGVTAQWGEHLDTDDGDIIAMSKPTTLLLRCGSEGATMMNKRDHDILEPLRKLGYLLAENPVPAPLPLSITRAGGFYIDIGAAGLIGSREIKHKCSPTGVSHFTSNSMVFPDGEEIEADEIVFATGYNNGRLRTRKVFGDKVANKIDTIWGYDEQGEIRGAWRRSGHDGFWVAAGPFWVSRYYSRLLALQIKAVEVGLSEV